MTDKRSPIYDPKEKMSRRDKMERAYAIADALTTEAQKEIEQDQDLFGGLSDRQALISKLMLRGVTQTAIAKMIGVSRNTVAAEVQRIRAHYEETGRTVNADYVIGESVTQYDEIMQRAWEIFYSAEESGDKIKALNTVTQVLDKKHKLLSDTGRIAKAPTNHIHTVDASPFVRDWEDGVAQRNVRAIIEAQFPELAAPVPPDEEILDAIIVEDDEDE